MRVKNIGGFSYDSNAYLIDAKRKTLVDAGMDASRVLKGIGDGLDLIVLTHCHYDHVGAVPDIVRETGAKVAMHSRDVPLLRSERASVASMFNAPRPEFSVDIMLEDGDTIDLGSSTLLVIHTPGHTPGSICLYNEETKELFTGDTAFEGGGFGRTDLCGDEGQMVASLQRLAKLDVSILYPGHGGIVATRAKESLLASYNNARHMFL
jgi:glyoxylase-like metal-dependent hydrolase (beta-lactamase superfamily II)